MLDASLSNSAAVLGLGWLIGMQHALEADHVAAVSSIAARQTSVRGVVAHGAAWGIGHAVTLMVVAGGAALAGIAIDRALTDWLEMVVGLMLIGLGLQLLIRLVRERVHFHRHHHTDGTVHFHAHSHAHERTAHASSPHGHTHAHRLPLRTLLVGMMHGMAGSAALFVLVASTAHSVPLGLGYVVLFGAGSVVGMIALSTAIAIPLSWSSRALTWANRGLQSVVGLATAGLGAVIVTRSAASLMGV